MYFHRRHYHTNNNSDDDGDRFERPLRESSSDYGSRFECFRMYFCYRSPLPADFAEKTTARGPACCCTVVVVVVGFDVAGFCAAVA